MTIKLTAYEAWLFQFVTNEPEHKNYSSLLRTMNEISFQVVKHRGDYNRMLDGFCLRQRYYGPIALEECSVLEMMVALAKRIDDDILYDYEIGTQTEKWFWMMIDSLGLSGMTDDSFDENTVTRIIYNFMDYNFAPDGKGGLFYVPGYNGDIREMEIWYQMTKFHLD